jgi:hypothetical protein
LQGKIIKKDGEDVSTFLTAAGRGRHKHNEHREITAKTNLAENAFAYTQAIGALKVNNVLTDQNLYTLPVASSNSGGRSFTNAGKDDTKLLVYGYTEESDCLNPVFIPPSLWDFKGQWQAKGARVAPKKRPSHAMAPAKS